MMIKKIVLLFSLLFLQPLTIAKTTPILTLDTYGHQTVVKSLLVSKDQRYIITASEDKTIRVWDIQSGRQTQKIIGQIDAGSGGKYFTADLSPDGKWLAAAGFLANFNGKNHLQIGAIRIFNLKTGELVYLLKGHKNAVTDLKFNQQGNLLASGSADGSVIVWQTQQNFNKKETLKGHKGAVQAVGFSPDGLILSAGLDQQIILWIGRKVRARYRHDKPFNYMAVSQNHIALSGYDHPEILILNQQLEKIQTIKTQSKPTGLAYSPNGKWLLTGSDNDSTNPENFKPALYDVEHQYQLKTTFNHHDSVVLGVNFINNNKVVTIGGTNQEIWIWNLRGQPIKSIKGVGQTLWAVGIDGNNIAWGKQWQHESAENNNPLLQSFNILKQQLHSTIQEPQAFKRLPKKMNGISLSHEGGGEYGFPDATLKIRKSFFTTKKVVRNGKDGYGHNVYGFTADGIIISGGGNGKLIAYNNDGVELARFIGHTGEIWSLASEGHWLVSGGTDQILRIWDLDQIKAGKKKILPRLNLFVDKKNDWVLWNEQGYYASSPNGDQYVGFHLNQGENKAAHFVTARQIKKDLYKPDQLKLALAIIPPPPPPPPIEKTKPEFKIIRPKMNQRVDALNLQIAIEIKKNPDIISGYKLFVNNKQVGNLPSRGLKRRDKNTETKYFNIPLESGQNKIRIEAFNAIGKTVQELSVTAPKPIKIVEKVLEKGEPPYFSVVSPKENSQVPHLKTQLAIAVKKDKYPVLGYAVYVNGQQISNLATRGLMRRKKEEHQKYFNLRLQSGKNTIKIVAHNKIGETIKTFNLFAPKSQKPKDERGKLYLISIGVDDYPNLDANLNYAGADAKAFFDVMLKRTKNMFKSHETLILTNRHGKIPNKRNVEAALHLFKKATPKDTVALFVAGHGINLGQDYYFLPTNTDYKNNDIDPATAVNWKILQNALDRSQGRRILFLDTCHSGAAFNPRLIKDASDSSIVVFSSTDAETLAQERVELGHGVFTYTLVAGIDGAADLRKDGIVKVKELDSFLSDEVERITNGEQIPVLNVPGGYKNFKFSEVH